jgi:protein gp37
MSKSSIEWTQETWNPTTGCSRISPGCAHCYAYSMSLRLQAMGQQKYKDGFKLRIHINEIDRPYSWTSPKIVFVNSMSDLFQKDVPISFIKAVFKTMNETPQHTYQLLTKRPELILKYNGKLKWTPNIWMGTSVENENFAHRIDTLRQTDAVIKFLSLEPVLGPLYSLNLTNIDWVIVGGESGHRARLVQLDWILNIQKQCEKAKVKFFFKQWGKPQFNANPNDPTINKKHPQHAKGGCEINSQIYREMPDRLKGLKEKIQPIK